MLMKSPTNAAGHEPRPHRPAMLAGFGLVVSPLLAASALLAFPPSAADQGAASASVVPAEATSPVNVIGSLEGLPAVRL
jgi:hypothetical protein